MTLAGVSIELTFKTTALSSKKYHYQKKCALNKNSTLYRSETVSERFFKLFILVSVISLALVVEAGAFQS